MSTLEQSEHTDSQRIEVTRFFRRNFALHSFDGGILVGGLSFIAPALVGSQLIRTLQGPGYLINLLPYLSMIGVALPSLLVAHKVEKMQKFKPFIMATGFFQRVPYLITGILLLTIADTHPQIALASVFLAPLLSGMFAGVSYTAWIGLVAKTILPERLCSVWASRMTISGIISLGAGSVVFTVLALAPEGFQGYGILYLVAFGVLSLSYVFFSFIHEPEIPPADNRTKENLLQNIRNIPSLLKDDSNFRLFLATKYIGNSVLLAMALFGIHALNVTSSPREILGLFLIIRTIGGLAGNAFASFIGDKYGAKVIMLIARSLIALNFVLIIFADRMWMFYGIFALSGFSTALGTISMSALSIKLTPKDKRATYLSVMGILNIPFVIGFGVIGGLLWDATGESITLPAGLAAGLLIFSLFSLARLQEHVQAPAKK